MRLRDRHTNPDYKKAVLDLGPVAYWRLGELAGTVARDEMGLNHGTYVGSPTLGAAGLLAGDPDTAMTFGVSKYVNCGSGFDYPTAFSAVLLVKPDATWPSFAVMMARDVSSGSYQWRLQRDDASQRLRFSSLVGNRISTGLLTVGTINHVGLTLDGTVVRFYIDGAPAGIGLLPDPLASLAATFRIGAYAVEGSANFIGEQDEPTLFNRVLSPGEIAYLDRVGRGR